jgi:hypothetical protein
VAGNAQRLSGTQGTSRRGCSARGGGGARNISEGEHDGVEVPFIAFLIAMP